MKEQKVAAASVAARRQLVEGSIIDESDYVDYARYYQEYDDDEEVEDYYYSSAAGRARIVIGNRRHGPNGYLSSGRMQARPNPPQQSASSSSKVSQFWDTFSLHTLDLSQLTENPLCIADMSGL